MARSVYFVNNSAQNNRLCDTLVLSVNVSRKLSEDF